MINFPMAKSERGICYLAGAGPGDPGLVTLKTRDVIGRADVVVYDHLCNPILLQWASPKAELVDAGKRAGAHTLPQEAITALLVRETAAGRCVVRLKGGDPFLFGRGGEEAEALAEAGLPFEIIPGVSSALAVPAYAGIPLTHRDHASQVTIFTGHEDSTRSGGDDAVTDAVDHAALAKLPGTKVMLMGVGQLADVVREWLQYGADPAIPAALIQWGTVGRQRTVTGTLANIVERVIKAGLQAPAVAVFGSVVSLREKLDWFEKRPLLGKRIVVTRSRKQAGALSRELLALGAEVVELPTIRFEPPEDLLAFGELVRDAHTYDWVIFTSPNGVDAFFEIFYKIYRDAREIGGVRIAAIGPSTAARIHAQKLAVDLMPEKAVAEELLATFLKDTSVENLKILIVRPEKARNTLPHELTRLGAIVDEAIAYRTVAEAPSPGIAQLRTEGADLVTFTSSSSAENFKALGLELPPGAETASIGPITSRTMQELGLPVDLEADKHDIAGLVAAILEFFEL